MAWNVAPLALSTIVMSTPGTIAPLGSLTIPVMTPRALCATAHELQAMNATNRTIRFILEMNILAFLCRSGEPEAERESGWSRSQKKPNYARRIRAYHLVCQGVS